jgi:hypothetical protein
MSRRDRAQEAPMTFFSFQDIVACTTGIMVIITILLALELVERAEAQSGGEAATTEVKDMRQQRLDLTRQRDELLRLQREKKILLDQLEGRTVITPEQLQALADKVTALEGRIRDVTLEIQRLLKQRDALALQAKEAELEKKKIQVTILEGKPARETQLFVECAATEGVVARVPPSHIPEEVKRFSGAQWPTAFLQWVKQSCDPAKQQFVLLVRPDAVDNKHCATLRSFLRYRGWGPRNEPFVVGWDVWPPERSLFKQP